MAEYTPQHSTPDNDDTSDSAGGDPTQTDLVAGDPPVPLTVWRTARTPADPGRSIGARLAARLIAAYSRPGEAVVDLTRDHALTPSCAAGPRQHHPAWFTDASSLIIGPATPPARTDPATSDSVNDGDDPPELRAWFGDDLTDPDLPPSGGPNAEAPEGESLQRATSLVVAGWPLHEGTATNRVRLAWLLTTCAALLRPGGCLILVVTSPATATPQDFSDVVHAAAGVGLGYLQHIVAVTADTDADAFVYHVTDEELLALARTTADQWQLAHLRVHADLLVFSQAQRAVPPRRSDPKSGGRRG
ncbi:hypothetical protein GCM10023322_79310 [Rugosimonospora acidiphila]|uniref:SAM-dependent methyltransferase n=1 Tax=Rugosimonospora acidiphila TaxID=556531 RepID=A0ABP9SQD1_9ACTN